MVKKPERGARSKNKGGRPLVDPLDLRSERFGFRLHPDLMSEMIRLARVEGLRLSIWLERAAIERVNRATGADVLDAIGRYRNPAPTICNQRTLR
jgi:hypothetical protein